MMTDRVHPQDSPTSSTAGEPHATSPLLPHLSSSSFSSNPPSGTYVIQVPKDQIYRVPAPENALLFETYTRRARRPRRPLRTCLICSAAILLILLFLLAVAVGTLFLVLRPRLPNYSVDSFSINSFNLTSEFLARVRADNPNKKISIRYRSGSSVGVSYAGVQLAGGQWPAFLQGKKNITVFDVKLKGSGVRLATDVAKTLAEDRAKHAVPLRLDVKVPVRIEFGAIKSWSVTVKVRCDVTVDKLTADSRILSKNCRSRVHFESCGIYKF